MEHTRTDDRLPIDVWSDIMCPFCYLGETLLGRALERFRHRDAVEIRYHSYQLMPHLPAGQALGVNELLERERGVSRDQAAAMNAQVAARAAEVGLDYRMDSALATNTRAAHRLIHFARTAGLEHELVLRLFRAYFTDGLDVGDHQVLADLAAEVGLDRAAALAALDDNAFEEEVEADLQQARRIGVSAVPFFVLDGRYAVTGAQPVETFVEALDTAWSARTAEGARERG